MNYYLDTFRKNYANFQGRAGRAEFWNFFLFNLLAYIVLSILTAIVSDLAFLSYIYGLGVLVPSLGIGARRLHDTNKSGWLQLIGIIPIVGVIVLIVFWALEGTAGPNKFGADPRQPVGFAGPTDYTPGGGYPQQ